MTYLYKFLSLALFALLGGLTYAVTVNLLIGANVFSSEQIEDNIGHAMTQKAVYIWLFTTVIGALSLFIKKKWQYIFLILPLIAPSLFAFIYALSA